MNIRNWLVALVAVAALALIAGCGSDSSSSSSTPASTTSSSGSDSSSTSSSSSSGNQTPEDVYNACIDAISGTPAEAAGKPGCQAAENAFKQCADQAGSLSSTAKAAALTACQSAANKAVAALKSAG